MVRSLKLNWTMARAATIARPSAPRQRRACLDGVEGAPYTWFLRLGPVSGPGEDVGHGSAVRHLRQGPSVRESCQPRPQRDPPAVQPEPGVRAGARRQGNAPEGAGLHPLPPLG